MLELLLAPLPATLGGIYRVGGVEGRLPKRALKLHPEAAVALMRLEARSGGLIYSDLWRSAEASLAAMLSKRGVQPPGYSGHNYGLSIDVAIGDYVPPGSMSRRTVPGVLTKLGKSFSEFLVLMSSCGWYCHRRDNGRGFEEWHFNYLGDDPDRYLRQAEKGKWSDADEWRIRDLYGPHFVWSDVDVQRALKKLGLYHGELDGILGPLSRAAISAFQRAWQLTIGPLDTHTLRTLTFVAADIKLQEAPKPST